VWQIDAGHYEAAGPADVPYPATVNGSFTASNGITAYLMTSNEFQGFASSGTASSYVWTSGSVSSATVDTNTGEGTYYVVFENTNFITSTSVQITASVDASW
jgi:hypothetical protein